MNDVDPYGLLPIGIEGVYQYIDTDGLSYTGQSSNVVGRLKYWERKGRLDANTEVTVTEVPGGKENREVYEYQKIRKKTGDVPARQSRLVSNQKDPIGVARSHLRNKKITTGRTIKVKVSGLRGFGYLQIISDLINSINITKRANDYGVTPLRIMMEDMGMLPICHPGEPYSKYYNPCGYD